MNTLERFYICDIIKLDNQINDKHTVKPNIIFYMIIKKKKKHQQRAFTAINV